MLYDRFVKQGTLNEPNGVPDPTFALPGTVYWMRALALLLQQNPITFASARSFYASKKKATSLNAQQENTIFEHLTFSLHQLSALHALSLVPRRSDVARVAIVGWYYGIYGAAKAMIAALDGSLQETHTSTASRWDRAFASTGSVMSPFDLRTSCLVQKVIDQEVSALRRGRTFALSSPARSVDDAESAICAYLKGSAEYFKWREEKKIRSSKAFKALNVSDFRSAKARQLRDEELDKKSVCFLHLAFRYRGKANYRETLYLAYGKGVETLLADHIEDLAIVLSAFVSMAGAYARQRLGEPLWSEFLSDLDKNRSFSVDTTRVWS